MWGTDGVIASANRQQQIACKSFRTTCDARSMTRKQAGVGPSATGGDDLGDMRHLRRGA